MGLFDIICKEFGVLLLEEKIEGFFIYIIFFGLGINIIN